ncbi:hypothetical protein BRADI_3g14035v3 [Brachypodium distachyon]|uniref:Uncharacterized protein n=1 Tax=Brachypodium distachyon TaxID=15368 RepID=A0A2K2CX11_BRADI|nr:hypothetical protein BRADI_3g14035v3 [Brachypodium distachyon]
MRNRISFTRESSKFIAIFYIAHIRHIHLEES